MALFAPIRGWHDAFDFIGQHHGDDLRKGTRSPYVAHVMAVAETLAYQYPEREDLIVAGLLHDVVEDTDASFAMVRERFGGRVERLVRAVSKDDDAMEAQLATTVEDLVAGHAESEAARILWRHRREFMLGHIRGPDVDPDVLRLKAADAHANLSSLERDLLDERFGTTVWQRFKVGRDESLWYYREVAAAVDAGIAGEPLAGMLAAAVIRVEVASVATALGRRRPVAAAEGVAVRVASSADADAIAPLLDAYRRFYGRGADPELAHTFLSDRIARGESTVLVAESDAGTPLGFVQLFRTFSTVRAAPTVILNDLFVDPVARGRGVGRALMAYATDAARALHATKLQLKTAVTNAPAQALYESLGWRRVDEFFEYELELS